MNNGPLRKWLRICFINLLIVAMMGALLRYKIIYPLPFIDQKHLLHGHSHFAFTGWISQALMVLMVAYLDQYNITAFRKYRRLLQFNLLSATGMLIAFPIQGYGTVSISFSTLSVIVLYFFATTYFKDLRKIKSYAPANNFFRAALLFNIISSAGAFALAFLMANKIVHQNWYLSAQYFFLHFQYNGWFFFVCMGLFTHICLQYIISSSNIQLIFRLLAFAAIPAYFLSTLWMNIPLWVFLLVIVAAFIQLVVWAYILHSIRKNNLKIRQYLTNPGKWVLILSGIALSIKFILQMGSTIPSLSILAFGFRPIVIGYLHLVLLAVTSLFIIGYIFSTHYIRATPLITIAILIFCVGIIINELLLMTQGGAAMGYVNIPYIQEALLGAALIMVIGLILLNAGLLQKRA